MEGSASVMSVGQSLLHVGCSGWRGSGWRGMSSVATPPIGNLSCGISDSIASSTTA